MKFNVIYMDPPWSYNDKAHAGKRGVEYKYPTMNINDIKSLPIAKIADDNCVLFLWVTFPMLQEGLDLIKAYGFKYKTCGFVWVKKNKKNDNWFMSLGHYSRANSEICLIGTKGSLKRLDAGVSQVVASPVESHSKKPDEVRNRIERLYGNVNKIELFARKTCEGWVSLGNDIDGKDISGALEELINK